MKVCYCPKYTAVNPYQIKLSESLNKLGVESEGIENSKPYLPREVRLRDSDILHIHWLQGFYLSKSILTSIKPLIQFILGLAIVKLKRTKIVWTAHNLQHHEQTYPIIDRICTLYVAMFANAIITHSKSAQKELTKTLPFDVSHKVHVIAHANYIEQYKNNITPTEARAQLNISESKTVFLFLGLIRPYKGVIELVEAFKQLDNPETYLVIAGKSSDKKLTNSIQEKINTHPAIKFLPEFIPDDDVQVYMNAANVVVFPYKNILTSGAVVLAMSFGRACLAPNKACITEVLDTHGAFLYDGDPDHKDGLLSAMHEAVHKKNLTSNMGEYNYLKAKSWDWEKVASQTLDVYKSVANQKITLRK